MKGDTNMMLRSKSPSQFWKGAIIHRRTIFSSSTASEHMYSNRYNGKKANENLNLKLKAASKRCVSSEVRS